MDGERERDARNGRPRVGPFEAVASLSVNRWADEIWGRARGELDI